MDYSFDKEDHNQIHTHSEHKVISEWKPTKWSLKNDFVWLNHFFLCVVNIKMEINPLIDSLQDIYQFVFIRLPEPFISYKEKR